MRKFAFLFTLLLVFIILPNAFGAIVTITQAVCNSGDANVTWTSGNTYFINADSNVDVENCQLTINPGTVVKFKATPAGNTDLNITNKGVLIAKGTAASKIVFTSENDCSVGDTITGTSNDANCGTAKGRDYSNAINLSTSAGLVPDSNDFAHLVVGYAKTGILISFAKFFNSIHDSNIHDNNSATTSGAGINIGSNAKVFDVNSNLFKNNTATSGGGFAFLASGTVVNFGNNTIINNTSQSSSGGAVAFSSPVTTIHDNNFSDNTAPSGSGVAISITGTTVAGIYNNVFSNNRSINGSGGVISVSGNSSTITNFYNNLFKSNSAKFGGAISLFGTADGEGGSCIITMTITNFYNNTFFDNNSNATNGGAIILNTGQVAGEKCSVITNFKNNIFAYSNGTAVQSTKGTITTPNNNAYWANDANTSGFTEGAATIYLGATPFINDNSDRNFLYNSYGITQLQGMGDSGIGTDSFFQGRTIRYDNRLDYNRSIGYHYDQNSPHINVLRPAVGAYTGNVLIDFNVSSNAANANVAIDLNLLKSATQDQNAFYLYQNYASWTCSQNLPTTTKDANCTYVLDSTTIADTNYLAQAKATDNNGTGKSILLNSFQIQNDSQSPDMNNNANASWQATDANIQIWCNDASKGNSDINSIAINKDSNGWTFFDKSALSVKRTDQNAYFTTDMNHTLQYFCNDISGNNTDTNTVYVLVDKTSPILTLTITSITSAGLSATITYTASATGGIKKYWISTDSGNSWQDNSTNTSYTFSISAGTKLPHTQTIWIKATNNSDQNTTIQTATIRFESATGGTTYCGDKQCNGEETPANCQLDCAPICGDGTCTGNETINTCPEDCAKICGDTYCTTDENCSTCSEDCGKCYNQPTIEGTIISQTTTETNPTTQQITTTLQQLNLEQLISQAMSIMQNYKIKRTITISQLQDNSYKTTITITTAINHGIQLTGLTLLEIVPKSAAQNASEITTTNEIVVLQEDPAIEFIATGKLEKEINFSYSINKRIENTADFTAPIILNQVIKTITTCATGCNDNNPCTKDQCLNQNCAHFLLPDKTPCGYAQQCRKGICITTQTTKYNPSLTIFGQRIEIIILIIGIILAFTAIGTHYHRKYRKKAE